jgi:hypothetical protein
MMFKSMDAYRLSLQARTGVAVIAKKKLAQYPSPLSTPTPAHTNCLNGRLRDVELKSNNVRNIGSLGAREDGWEGGIQVSARSILSNFHTLSWLSP